MVDSGSVTKNHAALIFLGLALVLRYIKGSVTFQIFRFVENGQVL
jgi:hypothetical protein